VPGNSPAPAGWHVVTPRIVTPDPQGLVRFLQQVFDAEGAFHPGRPAELRIGDSWLMISGDDERDPMPAFLYVYVEDAETTFQRAITHGATSLEDPRDTPYGDRRAMVRDDWGNTWQIAHRQAG
jgi:PhnB protein